MSYTKQTFVDRVVDNSGKVVTEGTKLTAAHLQHIEEGIVMVESAAKSAASTASSAASSATSAKSVASSALSAANEAQSTATTASNTADRAYSMASNASTAASNARSTASAASSTASNALTTASNALTTAKSKQDKLVSGTNIKTLNGKPILGEGDLEVLATTESLYDQAKKQITRFQHQCVSRI